MSPKQTIYLVTLLALTISVTFPCLNNGFTNWDDPHYVLENPDVKEGSLKSFIRIFTTDLYGKYNPLALISFAFEYPIAKERPFLYHFDNLLLHLINVTLVFCILGILVREAELAFLTALFFAIHPMQVESFAWISGRKDVLLGLFYLTGLWSYIRYRIVSPLNGRQLFLVYAAFLLALLTKPTAVSFPLILLLIDYQVTGKLVKEDLWQKIPMLFISSLFGILTIVNASRTHAFPASNVYHWPQRIGLSILALFNYLQKIFFPVNLSCFYPLPGGDLNITDVSLGVIAIILLVSFLARFGGSRKIFIFGLVFFLVTIIFALHIVAVNDSIIYDRFSYISGIGIFLIISRVFQVFIKNLRERGKRFLLGGMFLLLVYWTFLVYHTVQRCYVWRDSLTLWSNVLENYPQASVAYHNRGAALHERGLNHFALADLEKAVDLEPQYASAYFNRGNIYAQEKAISAAIKEYDQAIVYEPGMVEAYINRGNMHLLMGNWQQAEDDYNQALKRKPGHVTGLSNRGMAYVVSKDWEKARQDFSKVLDIEPTNAVALEKLKEIKIMLKHPSP